MQSYTSKINTKSKRSPIRKISPTPAAALKRKASPKTSPTITVNALKEILRANQVSFPARANKQALQNLVDGLTPRNETAAHRYQVRREIPTNGDPPYFRWELAPS